MTPQDSKSQNGRAVGALGRAKQGGARADRAQCRGSRRPRKGGLLLAVGGRGAPSERPAIVSSPSGRHRRRRLQPHQPQSLSPSGRSAEHREGRRMRVVGRPNGSSSGSESGSNSGRNCVSNSGSNRGNTVAGTAAGTVAGTVAGTAAYEERKTATHTGIPTVAGTERGRAGRAAPMSTQVTARRTARRGGGRG